MKKLLILVAVLLLAAIAAYADPRAEADAYVKHANTYVDRIPAMSAGPERNTAQQNARTLFEKALELYQEHLEDNPGDAGALEPLMTEINSRIFWCNKMTTVEYYKRMNNPTAEEIMEKDGVDIKAIAAAGGTGKPKAPPPPPIEELLAAKKPDLSPEELKKLADEARLKAFLDRIAYMVRRRRLIGAKYICKKALKEKPSGVPEALIRQIMNELEYVNAFLMRAFERAENMKGEKIGYAHTITKMKVTGTVKRFTKGILYIDVPGPGNDAGIEIGVPLFSMDDAFLVSRAAKGADKKIKVGIGSFYLLEGHTTTAQRIFAQLGALPGDPADLTPFLNRIKSQGAAQNASQTAAADQAKTKFLAKTMRDALKQYKRGKYDYTLKGLDKIIKKSGGDLEYLMPVSTQAHEATGKYLPEFAEEAFKACESCKGKRLITCPKCRGKGRVKPAMGGYTNCRACHGEGTLPCSACSKRIKSQKNKDLIENLRKIFKRDEVLVPAEGEGDGEAVEGDAPVEKKEAKPEGAMPGAPAEGPGRLPL